MPQSPVVDTNVIAALYEAAGRPAKAVVAAQAHVSRASVYRVLGGQSTSEEVLEAVRRVLHELAGQRAASADVASPRSWARHQACADSDVESTEIGALAGNDRRAGPPSAFLREPWAFGFVATFAVVFAAAVAPAGTDAAAPWLTAAALVVAAGVTGALRRPIRGALPAVGMVGWAMAHLAVSVGVLDSPPVTSERAALAGAGLLFVTTAPGLWRAFGRFATGWRGNLVAAVTVAHTAVFAFAVTQSSSPIPKEFVLTVLLDGALLGLATLGVIRRIPAAWGCWFAFLALTAADSAVVSAPTSAPSAPTAVTILYAVFAALALATVVHPEVSRAAYDMSDHAHPVAIVGTVLGLSTCALAVYAQFRSPEGAAVPMALAAISLAGIGCIFVAHFYVRTGQGGNRRPGGPL